jgi:hypothetical protein
MTLGEKQRLFSRYVATLILKAYDMGSEVSLGEAWRTPEQAARNAATGAGISNSLHMDRLAIDLNLFKNGVWLSKTEDHRPLGEWWEKQHPLCRWGGRFARPDGNHYSMTHGGRS